MFRFNKKNLLNLEYLNTPPLLSIDSKGEKNSLRIKKLKVYLMLIIINLQTHAIPAWMRVKKLTIK